MTLYSARLSPALVKRRRPAMPAIRPSRLAVLLHKRAAAHVMGDMVLEARLRDQIRRGLPMQRIDT